MGGTGGRRSCGEGGAGGRLYLLTEQVSHPQNGAWSFAGSGVEDWEREGEGDPLLTGFGRGFGTGIRRGRCDVEAAAAAAVMLLAVADEDDGLGRTICETLCEPRLCVNGLFLGPLGISPEMPPALEEGRVWRKCNLSLSSSRDRRSSSRSRCRSSNSFSLNSSSSICCFRLRISFSSICRSCVAWRIGVSGKGGNRSVEGDTAIRRGDIGSSTGWYLDAISNTLIGKRGMSFGACTGGSTCGDQCQHIFSTKSNTPK